MTEVEARLAQIEARLAEADNWGRERWHADGCTYTRSDAQFDCDCMRLDVEFLMRMARGGNETKTGEVIQDGVGA